jgi:hypothetical protein
VASGSAVLLVGHSIGGMIALTIAAMSVGPALLGVSATGMGAVVSPSEQLTAAAASSGQDVIALTPAHLSRPHSSSHTRPIPSPYFTYGSLSF